MVAGYHPLGLIVVDEGNRMSWESSAGDVGMLRIDRWLTAPNYQEFDHQNVGESQF